MGRGQVDTIEVGYYRSLLRTWLGRGRRLGRGLGLYPDCYDPASSLCKRNDVQGKGWLDFKSLSLTNGSAWTDTEDNVSGVRMGGSKGESMATVAEEGAEDTGSDGYR